VLTERRAEVEVKRRRHEAVDKQIKPLEAMLSRPPVWTNLLIDVAAAVGPDVQITRWGADGARGLCTITGSARTNADVFALVAALEAQEHFESVSLAGVTKANDTEGDGVHYEIVCSLRKAVR